MGAKSEQPPGESLIIPSRFNGPPTSANGGYVCGSLARRIGGTVEARLYAPPPLERGMDLRWEGENLRLYDGTERVAAAWRSQLRMDIPEPPEWEAAEAAGASRQSIAHDPDHPYRTCFVCGPDRGEEDGLRIFPGPLPGREVWATLWTPPDFVADENGRVPIEIVWAALDCPTIAAFLATTGKMLLSNFIARRLDEVWVNRPYLLLCWPIRAEERKRVGGAALFDDAGDLIAASTGTWVELQRKQAAGP